MSNDSALYKFELPIAVLPTLGCGGELKSSICLAAGKEAWLTPPIGDLEEYDNLVRYQDTVSALSKQLGITPQIIAHDLHPYYVSTRYAKQQEGVELIAVQHHHAHISSVMAEHKIKQPVIGICWDGTGFGTDGHLWGGEFLVADYSGFKRRGQLAYLPLPGGSTAIKEPYRVALSLLYATFGEQLTSLNLNVLNYIGRARINILLKMIDNKLNCPLSSGMGRLFDGLASIIRLADINSYEAEAAIALEQAAGKSSDKRVYPYNVLKENGRYIIDPRPMVKIIVGDIKKEAAHSLICRRFHNTLADMALKVCRLMADETGIMRVALSGGVFQNKLLVSQLAPMLAANGFEVFLPERLSPNDSSIALGQVMVANAGTNSCV